MFTKDSAYEKWCRTQRDAFLEDEISELDILGRYTHLAPFLRSVRKSKVLDIGAGIGLDAQALTMEGLNVTALDSSKDNLAKLHSRAPQIPCVEAVAQDIPFNRSFDAVLAHLLIHTMPRQYTERMMSEINRVLLPKGILSVGFPEERNANGFEGWMEKDIYGKKEKMYYCAWTERKCADFLNSQGFKPIDGERFWMHECLTFVYIVAEKK